MTTEDDFQRALDANPGDWQTRLVFADWLQERGDARAEGYRALGTLRKYTSASWFASARYPYSDMTTLPTDWYGNLAGGSTAYPCVRHYASRREAEDAAAIAFAKLPAARRAELLRTEVTA